MSHINNTCLVVNLSPLNVIVYIQVIYYGQLSIILITYICSYNGYVVNFHLHFVVIPRNTLLLIDMKNSQIKNFV